MRATDRRTGAASTNATEESSPRGSSEADSDAGRPLVGVELAGPSRAARRRPNDAESEHLRAQLGWPAADVHRAFWITGGGGEGGEVRVDLDLSGRTDERRSDLVAQRAAEARAIVQAAAEGAEKEAASAEQAVRQAAAAEAAARAQHAEQGQKQATAQAAAAAQEKAEAAEKLAGARAAAAAASAAYEAKVDAMLAQAMQADPADATRRVRNGNNMLSAMGGTLSSILAGGATYAGLQPPEGSDASRSPALGAAFGVGIGTFALVTAFLIALFRTWCDAPAVQE